MKSFNKLLLFHPTLKVLVNCKKSLMQEQSHDHLPKIRLQSSLNPTPSSPCNNSLENFPRITFIRFDFDSQNDSRSPSNTTSINTFSRGSSPASRMQVHSSSGINGMNFSQYTSIRSQFSQNYPSRRVFQSVLRSPKSNDNDLIQSTSQDSCHLPPIQLSRETSEHFPSGSDLEPERGRRLQADFDSDRSLGLCDIRATGTRKRKLTLPKIEVKSPSDWRSDAGVNPNKDEDVQRSGSSFLNKIKRATYSPMSSGINSTRRPWDNS